MVPSLSPQAKGRVREGRFGFGFGFGFAPQPKQDQKLPPIRPPGTFPRRREKGKNTARQEQQLRPKPRQQQQQQQQPKPKPKPKPKPQQKPEPEPEARARGKSKSHNHNHNQGQSWSRKQSKSHGHKSYSHTSPRHDAQRAKQKIRRSTAPFSKGGAPTGAGNWKAKGLGPKVLLRKTLGLFLPGGQKKRRSRPISRVLSWTVIPLGATSP